jgi:HAE1 family hydrophobic/amphiphilic exporter-1
MLLVFLTLAAIMESFKQPFIILVTVPLALIGMFYGLFAAGKSIELFALMGGVMLIGIVVNNAILIMDRLNVLVKEGVPRHQAMVRAACDRFRPVAMITLAAVLGMLPLATGTGIGAEMRQACGAASVGGIFVSGILTIYVLPVIYNMFTRRKS